MDSRKTNRSRAERKKTTRLYLTALIVVVIWIAVLALGLSIWYEPNEPVNQPGTEDNQSVQGEQSNEGNNSEDGAPEPEPEPVVAPTVVDFRMADLDHGWIQYSDGSQKVTADGGATWQEAAAETPNGEVTPDNGQVPVFPVEDVQLQMIVFGAAEVPVQKSQFLTKQVGWVLPASVAELQHPLLVTVDGGKTWNDGVTAEVMAALQAEKDLLQRIALEAVFYATPEQAKLAVAAEWMLFPETSAPGDVVLVRHNAPGSVKWQGKNYELQPFGAGYFTYLPVQIDVKAGEYQIGGATLKVESKKFDVQYLEVTEELDSMRQDTKRIQEDSVKISKARSTSAPEFLFTEDFMIPLEGRLTTPYGHTRYVNGKWDSSHQALDIAAPKGTPIVATNDGIVALAEELYLTGNAIYLDHGMGLFSQYAHMSELKVKVGDRVKKGDVIGLVGSTGFSTGPHLHFTFWAHNVRVNPNLFFDTTPFQWLDEE